MLNKISLLSSVHLPSPSILTSTQLAEPSLGKAQAHPLGFPVSKREDQHLYTSAVPFNHPARVLQDTATPLLNGAQHRPRSPASPHRALFGLIKQQQAGTQEP